ncbi:MAG: hypothetical protein QM756_26260 [Polyangiaceae bacterium]
MRWLIALAILSACGSKKRAVGEACDTILDCDNCVRGRCEDGKNGSPCAENYQCDYEHGASCIRNVCQPTGTKPGDPCGLCAVGLTCVDRQCLDPEGERRHAEAKAAAARKAEADKDAQMLAASGVDASPTAEVAAHPPGPGTRVRTVEVTAKLRAFAACKPDERLVGGGCRAEYPLPSSYPSGHSAEDTVGARWNCTVSMGNHEVTAYALCSKLP